MRFYVKEWPDSTATLMNEYGRVIWTFASVQEATESCREMAESENAGPEENATPAPKPPRRPRPIIVKGRITARRIRFV